MSSRGEGYSSIQAFMEQLDDVLDDLPPGQVRTGLLNLGRTLSPRGRGKLLRHLSEARRNGEGPEPFHPHEEGRGLLMRAERLATQIRDGVYGDDPYGDPELTSHRMERQHVGVEKTDTLLAETAELFFLGRWEDAAAAYGHILRAVAGGHTILGERGFPSSVLENDLNEAKARYFRSLYEVALPEQRPALLLQAMAATSYLGKMGVGLAAMANAHTCPLQLPQRFLSAWKRALDGGGESLRRFRPGTVPWLRVEAALLSGGAQELLDLVETSTDRRPSFHELCVLTLLKRGDESGAARAAGVAAEKVTDGRERAEFADWCAAILTRSGAPAEAVLDARKVAFMAEPNLWRLRLFLGTAGPGPAALHSVAGQLLAGLEADRDVPVRVRQVLRLMSGSRAGVVEQLTESPLANWYHSNHPGPIAFLFLLIAATGRASTGSGSALERFRGCCGLTDHCGSPMDRWSLGRDSRGTGPMTRERAEAALEVHRGANLNRLLCDEARSVYEWLALAASFSPPTSFDRHRYLASAMQIVEDRVAEVIGRGYRREYEAAAVAAAACAEAHVLAGYRERGLVLLGRLTSGFSKWRAFTKELRTAWVESPLLLSAVLRKGGTEHSTRSPHGEVHGRTVAGCRRVHSRGSRAAPTDAQCSSGSSALLTTPIYELGLSTGAANALQYRGGILTLGDLVGKTPRELLKLANFGRKRLEEVEMMLAEMGLKLDTT